MGRRSTRVTVGLFTLCLVHFVWVGPAEAACDRSGDPILVPASASFADVADCVRAASDSGDTIRVPAGNVTWNNTIDVGLKSITITGAGVGATIIAQAGFQIGQDCTTATNSTSISGFTINNAANRYTFTIYGAQGFRIHHNTITYAAAYDMLYGVGCNGPGGVEGLFDHNVVTYGRILVYGAPIPGGGSVRWAEPLDDGTSKALYVEDNTISWINGASAGYLNHIDGNWGCRYVMRFNDVNNGRFEAHALQGFQQRGCRLWEIYGNNLTNSGTPGYRPFLIRAGTGVIFGNVTDGGHSGSNTIHLDNPRTMQDDVVRQLGAWGACDDKIDAPQVDAQEPGGEGYPCRDQIGASTDLSLWSNYRNPGPAQAKRPAYIWNNRNTKIAGEMVVGLNCVGSVAQCNRQRALHLVEDRDWFQTDTTNCAADGSSCSSGVGWGTLAQRPSNCVTGAGYWATDQGSWNASTSNPEGVQRSGADGVLYRCTATNTWGAYYTPYTYPHPLQSGPPVQTQAPRRR